MWRSTFWASIWDYKNPELISRLAAIKQARYDRNEQMCERFRADGIDMTMESSMAILILSSQEPFCQNSHSRRRMQGHEPGVQKYLGKKCKYYIPTPDILAADAIRLIRTYGKAASSPIPSYTDLDINR
ncbi:MAG: hypothetical protein ACLTDF_06575 [Coprococcus sp.]